jgi:uncharacterized membrane protein YbhN (UPF0104 family)
MKLFSLKNRTGLLRLIGTLIAFVLLIYLLSQQGWQAIWAAIQQIPLWALALSFGLMMLSRIAVVGRWHVLLRSGGLQISFMNSFQITFAGLFATNFLPTTIGGDVVRLAGAVQKKLDAATSAASLIVDRLVGMAGMLMVLPFGIPIFVQNNPALNSTTDTKILHSAGFASLISRDWWKNLWEKGMRIFHRLLEALSLWLKQPRALLEALVFSWVHMLSIFGIMTILFNSLGEDVTIWQVGGLYSIVYFITLLPISINGYGLQEISMTFVFSELAGTSLANALTVALIFRTLMMLASLPGAAFLPGFMPGTQNQQDE